MKKILEWGIVILAFPLVIVSLFLGYEVEITLTSGYIAIKDIKNETNNAKQ